MENTSNQSLNQFIGKENGSVCKPEPKRSAFSLLQNSSSVAKKQMRGKVIRSKVPLWMDKNASSRRVTVQGREMVAISPSDMAFLEPTLRGKNQFYTGKCLCCDKLSVTINWKNNQCSDCYYAWKRSENQLLNEVEADRGRKLLLKKERYLMRKDYLNELYDPTGDKEDLSDEELQEYEDKYLN